MTHDIPHDLQPAAAREAAQKAVESYAARFSKYNFESNWVNEDRVELSFEVTGKRLHGSMSILPHCLRFEMDVPFVFRIFKNKAVEIMDREAKVWIDKARSGV